MQQFHFFTDARLAEFWDICKTLVVSVSPIVMIVAAALALVGFISMIVSIVQAARSNDTDADTNANTNTGGSGRSKSARRKQESDFEYREY